MGTKTPNLNNLGRAKLILLDYFMVRSTSDKLGPNTWDLPVLFIWEQDTELAGYLRPAPEIFPQGAMSLVHTLPQTPRTVLPTGKTNTHTQESEEKFDIQIPVYLEFCSP